MEKVDCLFVTSSKTGLIQFSVYPYLGIGYLSTHLKKKNLISRLYDADLNNNSISNLLHQIETYKPLVVGYSIMSMSLPFFYKVTKEIKRKYPNQIIVAGGPHVTNDPQVVFELNIDYGFVGYSEESFPMFLDKLKNGDSVFDDVKGMIVNSTNRRDKPILFDVSSSFEAPDYSLYDIRQYQNISFGQNWFTVITSRGCAYNCKFCKDPGRNRYKEYPLDSIKEQITLIVESYNIKWLTFVDDSFTYNRSRVIDLCNWMIEQKFEFKWTCMTRADVLDVDLIQLMRRAGLEYVIIGVEAGNEEVRKKINKDISNELYINAVSGLRKAGIRVLCSYVLGNIEESYDQMWQTIKFSHKLSSDYAQYYNMIALPNTPIFNLALSEKKLNKTVWYDFMRLEAKLPYYIPVNISLTKIKRIKFYAFISYYLKPSRFFDLSFRFVKFYFETFVKKRAK
jgi:anaerobic magnesium-protoporphyrin IX monomethyl ester cyclase